MIWKDRRRAWANPILWITVGFIGCSAEDAPNSDDGFPSLAGPYLGQTGPGSEPTLFAPGIVSTGMYERDVAIHPDGDEIYFGISTSSFAYSVIMVTRLIDGHWTEPEVAPFSGHPEWKDLEPSISPDGERFFFVSTRPAHPDSTGGNEDIWVMRREGGGWGEPLNLGHPVNSAYGEYFPSVTREGTIYFTREDPQTRSSAIHRSSFVDGAYAEPVRLPDTVNSTPAQFNAFIAPAEDYLIVCVYGREDSFGATDYYICFRSPDDVWTGPVNLGEKINTSGGVEYSPYVSPDGNYFFFMASRMADLRETVPDRFTRVDLARMHNKPQNGNADIYWVDAGFLETLRPD